MNNENEQRVLVLGGTGRVGTETIKALTRISPAPLSISVAGRNKARGAKICHNLTQAKEAPNYPIRYNFYEMDINEESVLRTAVESHDLVIHTAGPFQRRECPDRVLRASMNANVPYMDICDDLDHAIACKQLHEEARERGYIALISTGIYPGISNLMAAEAFTRLGDSNLNSLQLNYHTAGSGGIGATVLASTFLILSEEAVCYAGGRKVKMPAAGAPEVIDFEGKIGKRIAYLLNMPEVVSLRKYLLQGSADVDVCAKFSTGPAVWNWLLQAMAKWTPKEWLSNRRAMLALSQFSLPIVRAVDMLSGARTGIQIVAKSSSSSLTLSYEHNSLAQCVGEATVAFAYEFLRMTAKGGDHCSWIEPGVHFPEEVSSTVRAEVLRNATLTCNFFSTREASRPNPKEKFS